MRLSWTWVTHHKANYDNHKMTRIEIAEKSPPVISQVLVVTIPYTGLLQPCNCLGICRYSGRVHLCHWGLFQLIEPFSPPESQNLLCDSSWVSRTSGFLIHWSSDETNHEEPSKTVTAGVGAICTVLFTFMQSIISSMFISGFHNSIKKSKCERKIQFNRRLYPYCSFAFHSQLVKFGNSTTSKL